MQIILLCAICFIQLCVGIMLFLLFKRLGQSDTGLLRQHCESLEKGQVRLESLVREEITASRRELNDVVRKEHDVLAQHVASMSNQLTDFERMQRESSIQLQEKLAAGLNTFSASLLQKIGDVGQRQDSQLEMLRRENVNALKMVREETSASLKSTGEMLTNQLKTAQDVQKEQLKVLAHQLYVFTQENKQDSLLLREEVGRSLKSLGDSLRAENATAFRSLDESLGRTQLDAINAQSKHLQHIAHHLDEVIQTNKEQLREVTTQIHVLTQASKHDSTLLREEVGSVLKVLGDSIRAENATALSSLGEALGRVNTAAAKAQGQHLEVMTHRLGEVMQGSKNDSAHLRQAVAGEVERMRGSVVQTMSEMSRIQREQLGGFSTQMGQIAESSDRRMELLRGGVEEKLIALQQDNALQLEQMRQTVDEKLQGTLERRLGESFNLVSERLEQVQRGLGEMQALAHGVGDLKKVLTNVKTRGIWGEIHLGNLLEQLLTNEQFAANVAVKAGAERVEFAIKLPGRDEEQGQIWLPIDAKFPQEDYLRLLEAQESADPEAVELASKGLEARIKSCAQTICQKYVSPPHTTDFAIMYLPSEGLYAEVIRRTGLVEVLHRECRVVVAGPTTLAALLNSLQMGFRTLAIQKRSSEVWHVLSGVKTEFGKYSDVLDKVKKKLTEAQNTIDQASTRTRVIQRNLQRVESVPQIGVGQLALVDDLFDKTEAANDN